MDNNYLTDYTESIKELSQAFEFLVTDSMVRSSAKPEGLISIEIENSDSYIISILKSTRYKTTLSKRVTKKLSPNTRGIIISSPHIRYETITNHIE